MPLTCFVSTLVVLLNLLPSPDTSGYQQSEPANVADVGVGCVWENTPAPLKVVHHNVSGVPRMSSVARHLPRQIYAPIGVFMLYYHGLMTDNYRLTTSATTAAAHGTNGTRRHSPSHPRHLCHFGGSHRTTRGTQMPIQRHLPSHPPAISAEVLQKLHEMQ